MLQRVRGGSLSRRLPAGMLMSARSRQRIIFSVRHGERAEGIRAGALDMSALAQI